MISAVSAKQAGLASGTLGMVRNIGTAFGVAILSQVYLFHINTTLPPSLTVSRAAADQFLVAGIGVSRAVAAGVILQGFKLTALAGLVFCITAAIFAFFMRTRLSKKDIKQSVTAIVSDGDPLTI